MHWWAIELYLILKLLVYLLEIVNVEPDVPEPYVTVFPGLPICLCAF